MIKFNKNILVAVLLIVVFVPVFFVRATSHQGVTGGPTPVSNGVTGGPTNLGISNPLSDIKSVGSLVNKFVEIFSYIVIIFAVLAIIWTGLQLILARGNPEKMKEASKQLGNILIGVAIVIGARIMIMVIINTLEATGTVNPNVIQKAKQGAEFK